MKSFLTFLALLIFAVSFPQSKEDKIKELKKSQEKREKERDSFSKIDLLSKEYKYLDEKFQIIIDSATFSKISSEYRYRRTSVNYKDSLRVILDFSLKSDVGVHLAFHRILYKWENLSYYLWKTEKETKVLGKSLGFEHPYRFYEYLMDENINTPEKLSLLNELKIKIEPQLSEEVNIKPYKPFLKLAFKINPARQKAMDEYLKKNSNHKH